MYRKVTQPSPTMRPPTSTSACATGIGQGETEGSSATAVRLDPTMGARLPTASPPPSGARVEWVADPERAGPELLPGRFAERL